MNRRTNLKTLLVISVFLLAMAGLAQARIITVGHGAGYDFNTIQAAINDSNDGDTIIVADGIYTGQGNRDIDFVGKAIVVRSQNGPENCIIDCNGTESEPHRGFYFHSGEDDNSVLRAFTIKNGYAAYYGGAILCFGSSPILTNCTITGNISEHNGGGMYNYGGSPKLNNCTFTGNRAEWGGGMLNSSSSSPILTNCTFNRNSAALFGGAMGIHIESNPTLTNCSFTRNWANCGGAVQCGGNSSPTLTNCTFTGNSAGGGGGMECAVGSKPTLTNCTFSGNLARIRGGATTNCGSNSTFTNCTFAGNLAPNGSAIACGDCGPMHLSSLQLTNCIFRDGGNEIFNEDGSTIVITYSDMQGGWPGEGNIDANACFAEPGYWDANNTPDDANDDFWVGGDYHLKSQAGRWDPNSETWVLDDVTSACIDAGKPGCLLGDEPNDPNNIRINMGAYGGTAEASKTPANWRSIADLTNDWTVDFNDLKVFVDYWLETGECIPSDLNRSQSVDFSDFAIFGKQWSDTLAIEPGIGKD